MLPLLDKSLVEEHIPYYDLPSLWMGEEMEWNFCVLFRSYAP